MRVWPALMIATASACANVPDAPFDRTDIQVELADGNVRRIIGPAYEMELATDGVRMPEKLLASGKSLLAAGSCPGPSLAGTGVFPITVAMAGHPALSSSALLDEFQLAGPVVARVAIHYDVPYTCSTDRVFSGDVLLTFLPSGRIIRQEKFAIDQTVRDGEQCSHCGEADSAVADLHVDSFWAFDATSVVDSTGAPLAAGSGTDYFDTCAIAEDHVIGVRWTPDNGGVPRLDDENGMALSYRFDAPMEVDTTERHAYSELAVTDLNGPAGCREALSKLDDAPLAVGGKALEIFNGVQFIGAYAGEPIVIDVGGSMDHGFALGLDIDTAAIDHLLVTKNGGEASFFLQVTTTGVVIWIDDSVESGDTIEIEAL